MNFCIFPPFVPLFPELVILISCAKIQNSHVFPASYDHPGLRSPRLILHLVRWKRQVQQWFDAQVLRGREREQDRRGR